MQEPRSYRVRLTHTAKQMLRRLGKKYGKSTYQVLRDLIQGLEIDPGKRGESLKRPLAGFYSLHHGRFRVVYIIRDEELIVLVVAAGYHRSGDRNDIYRLLQRLIKQGQLDDLEVDAGDDN